MAKKHRIFLPVLALLLIGACSRNEEIEQPTSPSGGVEVAILCDNTKHPDMLHGLKVEYFIIRVLEMMVVNTL